jgi:hypothetical protein
VRVLCVCWRRAKNGWPVHPLLTRNVPLCEK